ncbi:unnamed protein product [Moneuplotes crassus]|uniref:Uncharacterized protein n=1 Tax=Euplotes crassus TaxID=5936 RepID=A0AAD1U9L4_EUPCR|nr:unnamed protein product [Moneuplotes crassus]
MPHSEDELDLTDGSKQGSASDKISTFTEIAARVGKDLHEKGYKNSELDWLELETKMREMLSEQLQIVFKTFDKKTDEINQLKKAQVIYKKKMDKIDHSNIQNTHKIEVCHKYIKKVKDIEGKQRVSESKTKATLDNFLTKIEKQFEDINSNADNISKINDHLYGEDKDTPNIDDKLILLKGEIHDSISASQEENLKRYEEIQNSLNKLESLDSIHSTRLDNNKALLTKVQAYYKKITHSHKSIRDELRLLGEKKCDRSDFLKSKSNLTTDIHNLTISLENTKRDLREVESYLIVYRPVKEFSAVVRILDHIFTDKKERKRLNSYVANMKNFFNEAIAKKGNQWPEYDRKEVVDLEIPKLVTEWTTNKGSKKFSDIMSRLKPTPSQASFSSDKFSHLSREESYINNKGQKVREITMSIISSTKKKGKPKRDKSSQNQYFNSRPESQVQKDDILERSPTQPKKNRENKAPEHRESANLSPSKIDQTDLQSNQKQTQILRRRTAKQDKMNIKLKSDDKPLKISNHPKVKDIINDNKGKQFNSPEDTKLKNPFQFENDKANFSFQKPEHLTSSQRAASAMLPESSEGKGDSTSRSKSIKLIKDEEEAHPSSPVEEKKRDVSHVKELKIVTTTPSNRKMYDTHIALNKSTGDPSSMEIMQAIGAQDFKEKANAQYQQDGSPNKDTKLPPDKDQASETDKHIEESPHFKINDVRLSKPEIRIKPPTLNLTSPKKVQAIQNNDSLTEDYISEQSPSEDKTVGHKTEDIYEFDDNGKFEFRATQRKRIARGDQSLTKHLSSSFKDYPEKHNTITEAYSDLEEEELESGESEEEAHHFGVSIDRVESKIQEAVDELQKEFKYLLKQNLEQSTKDCASNTEYLHKIFRSEMSDRFNILDKKTDDNFERTKGLIKITQNRMEEGVQTMQGFIRESKVDRMKFKDRARRDIEIMKETTDTHNSQIDTIHMSIRNITHSITHLFQNEYLCNALQLQDEKDRHSIALWGAKNTTKMEKEKYNSHIDPHLISGESKLLKRDKTSSLFNKRKSDDLFTSTVRENLNKSSIQNIKKVIETKNNQTQRHKAKDSAFSLDHQSFLSIKEIEQDPIGAIKQRKNALNNTGVITLDKSCYSCTNQNSIILTAFKIACLGYSPSKVHYQGQSYTRDMLIQFKANKIKDFWQEMRQLIPFGSSDYQFEENNKNTEKDIKTRAQTALKSELGYSEYCNTPLTRKANISQEQKLRSCIRQRKESLKRNGIKKQHATPNISVERSRPKLSLESDFLNQFHP